MAGALGVASDYLEIMSNTPRLLPDRRLKEVLPEVDEIVIDSGNSVESPRFFEGFDKLEKLDLGLTNLIRSHVEDLPNLKILRYYPDDNENHKDVDLSPMTSLEEL